MTGLRLVLITALSLAGGAFAAPPAGAQQSAAIRVIRDCGDNGRLEGTYSRADLRAALRALPSDQEEYSYCRDAILAAQTAVRRPEDGGGSGSAAGSGTGGGGTSGAATGSSGGSTGTSPGGSSPPGSSGGSLPGLESGGDGQPAPGTSSGGSGTGAEPDPGQPEGPPVAPAAPTGPTPEDLAELERAASATTPPAALARARSRDLPTALLLALICLGVAAALAVAPLIRHLRPPAGRGPLVLRRR